MDTTEAAVEADIELDAEALARLQDESRLEKGKNATKVGKGGIRSSRDDVVVEGEGSPLLSREREHDNADQDDRRPSWTGAVDFHHLPWYRRPSLYWVLLPFFFLAVGFGGALAPKMNLIQDLICREYLAQQMALHPGLIMAPVDLNGSAGGKDQCAIPEVSARTSMFVLWGSIISGVLSAFTAPKLGALSDRYGRKPILMITSIGAMLAEIITIFAALYPTTFPVWVLLVSYALDGLTGSFIVSMSIANAYATDCTPPNLRSVAFGYFHGCLFTGLAIGPILAGYVVQLSGKIVVVFYAMVAVDIAFLLFIGLVVPESLSTERKRAAQEKHQLILAQKDPNRDWINQLRHLNVLEPLSILRPKGPGSSRALRRNLLVLAAVDTIVFGVYMGSMSVTVIYMRQQFGWHTFESGKFMTVVNTVRVLVLLVVLPVLTRLVRGRTERQRTSNTGADNFELYVTRVAVLFDTLGYLGYTLVRSGGLFTLSGVVASVGVIGSPTLQSALTKHVPAARTGQLLGAMALLHSLARVVAPTVFSAIFAATVGKFSQTVFVCLAATFGVAFLTSWFIRPHVFYDEERADEDECDSEERRDRIPIASSVAEALYALVYRVARVHTGSGT